MVGFVAYGFGHPDNQSNGLFAGITRSGIFFTHRHQMMILVRVASVQRGARAGLSHQRIATQLTLIAVDHSELDVVGQLELLVVNIGAALLVGNVDAQLVLECQSADVLYIQHGELNMTRLPQSAVVENRDFLVDLLEVAADGVLVCNLHFQINCLDLVYRSARGIGKPGERCPDQHDHTHDQCHDAGQ